MLQDIFILILAFIAGAVVWDIYLDYRKRTYRRPKQ